MNRLLLLSVLVLLSSGAMAQDWRFGVNGLSITQNPVRHGGNELPAFVIEPVNELYLIKNEDGRQSRISYKYQNLDHDYRTNKDLNGTDVNEWSTARIQGHCLSFGQGIVRDFGKIDLVFFTDILLQYKYASGEYSTYADGNKLSGDMDFKNHYVSPGLRWGVQYQHELVPNLFALIETAVSFEQNILVHQEITHEMNLYVERVNHPLSQHTLSFLPLSRLGLLMKL